ncbi:MAG: flagellar brake protein [Thermincolia bacterium]
MYQVSGLEIRQLVEVEITEDENPVIYRSRVENITNSCIVLGAPMEYGRLVHLPPGTKIRVSYYDDKATYTFDSAIIDRNMGTLLQISIERPSSIKRTQRRNFVRINTKLPVSYTIISDELPGAAHPQQGTALDVSGGGIRFQTSLFLPEGTVLELKIDVQGLGQISALGKVVRTISSGEKDANSYVIGVQFMIIEEKERDKIIRHIFDKQRELRQRGLL